MPCSASTKPICVTSRLTVLTALPPHAEFGELLVDEPLVRVVVCEGDQRLPA